MKVKKNDSTFAVNSIYCGKPADVLGNPRSIHRVGCGLRKAAQGWGSAARLYAPIHIYKQRKGSEKMEEKSNRKRKTKIGEKRPSKRKTVSQTTPCDFCGDTQWDEDLNRGETYCLSCGNVVEVNTIDPGAEWTNHTDGPDRSRVGAPARNSLSDKGLNTTIAQADVSGIGAQRNGIKGSNAKDWRRWRIMDERSKNRSSLSRNLTKAMQFIRDKGGLPPSLTECAAHLYRKAAKMGVVTGRSIRGVSAACVYLTAREVNLPRTIDDIAIAFDMTDQRRHKELTRTIRLLTRKFGAHHITGPQEYLEKFHSDLDLPISVLRDANRIWDKFGDAVAWQGKRPTGVAGVLLYRAAKDGGHRLTQSQVGAVATVSEVTIRQLLRILEGLIEEFENRAATIEHRRK